MIQDLAGASEVTAAGAEQLYRHGQKEGPRLRDTLSYTQLRANLFVQGAVYADAQQHGLPELGRSEREAAADRGRRRPDFEPGMSLPVEFVGFDYEVRQILEKAATIHAVSF